MWIIYKNLVIRERRIFQTTTKWYNIGFYKAIPNYWFSKIHEQMSDVTDSGIYQPAVRTNIQCQLEIAHPAELSGLNLHRSKARIFTFHFPRLSTIGSNRGAPAYSVCLRSESCPAANDFPRRPQGNATTKTSDLDFLNCKRRTAFMRRISTDDSYYEYLGQ